MSKKFRLDRKIGFQNTFYTKCINVIIDSIGPSIILRSIYTIQSLHPIKLTQYIVGEPNSRIVQRHKKMHPRGIVRFY